MRIQPISIERRVLYFESMDSQKEMFIEQWKEKFPGVDAPDLKVNEVEDIEKSLASCKSLIKSLEDKLSQEKFHLVFLQTYLAAKKKTYTSERWGFTKTDNSSFESEKDPCSPTPDKQASVGNQLENGLEKHDEDSVQTNNKAASLPNSVVRLRQSVDGDATSGNRLSKVLENVKLFERKVDSKDLPANSTSDNASSNFHPKSSVRKRSSYLEVWECKTGAEKEQNERSSNDDAKKAIAAGKPQPAQRGPRKDYVEMWTCNSGDQISVGVVYDDQSDNFHEQVGDDYGNDMENAEDYDVEDIDMKDGFGKQHYTIAGSSIKLRSGSRFRNDPPSIRGTWPAAGPQYQEDKLIEDGERNIDQVDGSSIDLSDFDNGDVSDSQESESSREDSVGSTSGQPNQEDAGLNVTDTSPLHRLRRAQTTNERMSVAHSAFSEWSDDERATSDRTSMLSVQSIDLHTSDEEGHLSDDENTLPTATVAAFKPKSDSPTPIFVFSRPKNNDTDVPSDDGSMADNRKSIISVIDGSIPEVYSSSPKGEAVSDMVDYHKVRSIAEAEKLRMRHWVLTSLLDNEEAYLEYLNTLILYMKPLKATIGTSQPVMSAQDFDTLFYRVPELHTLHGNFYAELKPRLDAWSADTTVGDLFKKLLSKLNLYGDYLNNYKRAQHTVEKCAKENQHFAKIIESLKVQSRGSKDAESISLIDVLYKPVERVMRTTLVLQDLLKHTPHRHPDYQILRQVLKHSQIFLERINSTSSSSFKPRRVPSSAAAAARSAHRELIKDGFLVEIATDGSRKLRHCFLYSDLLLCAKKKSGAGVFHSKDSYECKWYIPLADLSFQPKEDSEVMPEVPMTSEEDLRQMSNRAQQYKRDIAKERKKNAKKSSDQAPVRSRNEERMRKRLMELEAKIVLAAPDLPLRIYHMQGKSYMFLMSSDYERIEWTEAVMKQQESCFKSFSLTSLEVNMLLANCVRQRKRNKFGSMMMNEDEELLSGYLNVTIHSGQGFLRACNPYCTLEVDSYGQFQTKAKTRPCRDTNNPEWNEEFELDLDGAMTLRILCYDRAREASAGASYDDDVLIAKGKVGLIQESLRDKGEWIEECVLMNELTIRVSVKFTPRERSLQRVLSKKANGLFGVKIEISAKRDSSGIPGIVRKCVAEVERRGMSEVGIYRVSGIASEIQALKASFDTDRKDVNILLGEVDINAVAGVLKLYFRELPEPLFTDARYSNFLEAASLTDPETKLRTVHRLLSDLPPANYRTLHFLRNHLLQVAQNEHVNKMNLHNLATVFGPTLLRPAEDKNPQANQALMLNALRLDVHYQMDVLLYCLELDEMIDYEALKNGNYLKESAGDGKPLSRSQENLSSNNSNQTVESLKNKSLTRSLTTDGIKPKSKLDVSSVAVVPPPASQPRYHPYEEIYIPPANPKPKAVRPPVVRKPSVDGNGRSAPTLKPKPAPRRPQMVKTQLPVVTDL